MLVGAALAPLDVSPGGSAVYAVGSARSAGIFATPEGTTHAFVNLGQVLQDLGTLGGDGSAALGVNEKGDVVGTAETPGGHRHAFLARAGGTTLLDLSTRGGDYDEARDIDSAGNILVNSNTETTRGSAWVVLRGGEAFKLAATDRNGAPLLTIHAAAISDGGRIVGWGVEGAEDSVAPVRCLTWTVTP